MNKYSFSESVKNCGCCD